jgi:hypothetical protein
MAIDWETSLKAAGLIGAGVGWLYQARATILRGKIKTDLEILEKSRALFGNDDPRSRNVENGAGLLMSYLYRDAGGRAQGTVSWPDVGVAIFCTVGAAAFGREIVFGERPPVWQMVAAAVLSFVALGAVLNALDRRRSPAKQ